MAITNLVSEVTSCPAVPDGLATIEALVGDNLSFLPFFQVPATGAAPVVTLVRKPASSAAAVTAGAITFDAPGYYYVTIANCGLSRSLTVVTFPTAAIGVQGASRPGLRKLLNTDTRITPTTMTAALETFPAAPVFGGLSAILFGQVNGPATFVIPFS